MKHSESADYVIVGAGSAGCVLASRLSGDSKNTVVLLEAGGGDRHPLFNIPGGFFPLMKLGKGNWNYETTPQSGLNNRRCYFPRGKVIGGSSAINGLVVSRGNPGDYDHWRDLGNDGWSFQDCLPYFKKIESVPEGSGAWRGQDGPVKVSFFPLDELNPVSKAWIEGGRQAGHRFNSDMNAGNPDGMAQMQGNYADGQRQSASACYLRPALGRPNLKVLSGATVTRVLIEEDRAVGVEYTRKGQTLGIKVKKEVILAGGVINSPQILQLSGIGDPADIEPFGIRVVHTLPGVGKNLKDHMSVSVKCRATKPYSLLGSLKPLAMARTLGQYLFRKSGPAMTGPLEVWAHLKSDPALPYPDLQIYSVPLMYNDHGRDIIPEEGFMAVINASRPLSSGTVKLQSPDPMAAPAIDPGYLTHPSDLAVVRQGIRLVREIFRQAAYDEFRGEEYAPGANILGDDELDSYIREQGNSIYHPVGTCGMGSGPLAVVDQQLKVHGITGLRVVDASVMPDIISGNTNFPVMMIAERAADFILGP